jgi:tetratricopeptide (TPR) repeat protein
MLFLAREGKAAEADLLLSRLNKVNRTEKADLLNQISVAFRQSDITKAAEFATKALVLSQQLSYPSGEALAFKNLGICFYFEGVNDSAMFFYRKSLAVYTSIGNRSGMSACYNNLGLIAQETGDYESALKNYNLSVTLDHSLGDKNGVAATQANIADILIYKGKSTEALQLLQQVLDYYRDVSDKNGIMRTLINRGSVFDNLLMFEQATSDHREAIRLANELGDRNALAVAKSNLGLITWHRGDCDKALKLLNEVLEMTDQPIPEFDIQNTLWIMADIYTSMKNYSRANEILLQVLKNYELTSNKRAEAKVLTSLGRNLMETNEMDKALGYFNESLLITNKLKIPYEQIENYRNLVYTHAIIHEFDKADSLISLYAKTHQSLFASDSLQQKLNLGIHPATFREKASYAQWFTALLLMFVGVLLSVIAYHQKN